MRYRGIINKWNDDKGFGFVMPKGGGQPVFVHAKAFINRQRPPRTNGEIIYELGSDRQGRCCAVNVRYLDDSQRSLTLRFSVMPVMLMLGFILLLGVASVRGSIPLVIGVAYVALSVIAFTVYALDKSAAEQGRWRTQESRLQLLGLFGGWPGAILAQQLLRHKSGKASFQTVFWGSVVLNCGALAWLMSPGGLRVRTMLEALI
jgi:uncharacterized membrane protein YsdA (DUF1294 family)/cold shock CspA family protein